jgi:hypothetical protein
LTIPQQTTRVDTMLPSRRDIWMYQTTSPDLGLSARIDHDQWSISKGLAPGKAAMAFTNRPQNRATHRRKPLRQGGVGNVSSSNGQGL